MTLIKWDPVGELRNLHRTMDRVLGDRNLRRESESSYRGFSPSVDVYETEKEIVVEAEVPGVAETNIAVEVKENILTLSGERKKDGEIKYDDYHCIERTYGKFKRAFAIPDTIETDKVKAKTKNGVLTVRLPKAPKTAPRKIAVSVE